MTPRAIWACIEAWTQDQDRWNIRFGTVAAASLNAARKDRRDKVFSPDDFFKPLLKRRPKVATAEQIQTTMRMLGMAVRASLPN